MVFLQGCGGNCGTGKWIAGTPQEDVVAMGGRLAEGIESALAGATPVDLVRSGSAPAASTLRSIRPRSARCADLEAALAAVAAAPEPDISKAHEIGDRLAFVEQVAAGWKPRVVAARAGDLALVEPPGRAIRPARPPDPRRDPRSPRRSSTAYDDNSLQYVPTAEDFPEGAYEVDGGWRYVAPGGGEAIADAALDLLRTLAV